MTLEPFNRSDDGLPLRARAPLPSRTLCSGGSSLTECPTLPALLFESTCPVAGLGLLILFFLARAVMSPAGGECRSHRRRAAAPAAPGGARDGR